MASGHSKSKRQKIWKKTKGRCAYCGCALGGYTYWHAEHAIPKDQGGSDKLSNLVPSCPKCNSYKSKKNPKELADYIIEATMIDLSRALERLDHFSDQLSVMGGTVRGLKSGLKDALLEVEQSVIVEFFMPELTEQEAER